MKKIISLILSLLMLFTMSVTAFAAEVPEDKTQELTGAEWDAFTVGEDYYIDENGDIIYTYEQEEEIPISYSNPVTRAIETDILIIKASYGYNSTTGKLKFIANIDCPTSLIFKPDISISLKLTKANTKNGTYTTAVAKTAAQDVKYATDYYIEYSGTNHYKFTVYLTANDENTIVTNPTHTFYSCRNRTGKVWDYYHTDANSGVTIAEPQTNWTVNQQSRPSNLNTTYQNTYNATYGTNIVVGSDVGVEVHHVRPLKYGGSNNMSNLVHIDKSFHSKITGWFAGY